MADDSAAAWESGWDENEQHYYYYNHATGESTWTKPLALAAKWRTIRQDHVPDQKPPSRAAAASSLDADADTAAETVSVTATAPNATNVVSASVVSASAEGSASASASAGGISSASLVELSAAEAQSPAQRFRAWCRTNHLHNMKNDVEIPITIRRHGDA